MRPCCLPNALLSCSFQSTHSLRSATSPNALRKVLPISFNPRTPCGVRLTVCSLVESMQQFQSTHSLRSATAGAVISVSVADGFNPRTPCGVRHHENKYSIRKRRFQSTHSLRSATVAFCVGVLFFALFQSTHSLRSATIRVESSVTVDKVSIHALLAECDQPPMLLKTLGLCFNPRTPCGVRRYNVDTKDSL